MSFLFTPYVYLRPHGLAILQGLGLWLVQEDKRETISVKNGHWPAMLAKDSMVGAQNTRLNLGNELYNNFSNAKYQYCGIEMVEHFGQNI